MFAQKAVQAGANFAWLKLQDRMILMMLLLLHVSCLVLLDVP